MNKLLTFLLTLTACGGEVISRRCPDPKADPLVEAKRLVKLDRLKLKIDCPHGKYGHRICRPNYNGNGMFTGVAGVMIEDAIYYEALGIGSAYSATMDRLATENANTMAGEQFKQSAEQSKRLRAKSYEKLMKPRLKVVGR